MFNRNEKPLDSLIEGYSNTSIFRAIAFIGDSLSSGEFETVDKDGNKGYHDMFDYSWEQYTLGRPFGECCNTNSNSTKYSL